MAEAYRGYQLTDAFGHTRVALYERGSFQGHFPGYPAARAFVDAAEMARGSMRGEMK